jgi:hypothetical protein
MKRVMQAFIRPGSFEGGASVSRDGARRTSTSIGGASFRDVLAATLEATARAEREIERSLTKLRSPTSGPAELIVLQAAVYRTARDFELLAKLVDKSTGAVKQALQSTQG